MPPYTRWKDFCFESIGSMKIIVFPLLKTRSRSRERRSRRVQDQKHLAYVAGMPCCVPGCHAPATVHHLRCLGSTAAGSRRSGDNESVPLCKAHHQGDAGVEAIGERKFWPALGIDPLALAAKLWAESHAGAMP